MDALIIYCISMNNSSSTSSTIKVYPRETIITGLNDGPLPNKNWPSDHIIIVL